MCEVICKATFIRFRSAKYCTIPHEFVTVSLIEKYKKKKMLLWNDLCLRNVNTLVAGTDLHSIPFFIFQNMFCFALLNVSPS